MEVFIWYDNGYRLGLYVYVFVAAAAAAAVSYKKYIRTRRLICVRMFAVITVVCGDGSRVMVSIARTYVISVIL
jgi:hypothetical protein